MASPVKFVKPAELFKMRQKGLQQSNEAAQSPLKCLNVNESPAKPKGISTIIANPFRQAKRKLKLDESPVKRPKMQNNFEIDEDANLEAPKFSQKSCYKNDWTLRTKLSINFPGGCKNWTTLTTTIHKRLSGSKIVDESPSKLNDKTISLEAIKNVATVYQHPYMSWLPLYPRMQQADDRSTNQAFFTGKNTKLSIRMHQDWCESLDDLLNLMLAKRCPYFYMCSDYSSILFKPAQACIAPFSFGMGCEFNKLGITFRCPQIDIKTQNKNSKNENADSKSQNTDSRSQNTTTDSKSQNTDFKDCGNSSSGLDEFDYDDDRIFLGNGENDQDSDITQVLDSIGTSMQEFPELKCKRKGFIETDSCSDSQVRQSTSNKPLAVLEGFDNIKKLVDFLKATQSYTISTIGKFARIPPTLLAPCEFRLCTPQYPEVTISSESGTSSQDNLSHQGPRFVSLKGTILPNLHTGLHKILKTSYNDNHTCSATELSPSCPFGTIEFS